MRSLILLSVVLLGLAAPNLARGQESAPSRPLELGVDIGAIKFEDPLMNGETHTVLGGRAAYRFSNGVTLGSRIGRTGRDETIEAIGGGRIGIDVDLWLYGAEVGYVFNPGDRARFSVSGGVGAARFVTRIDALDPPMPGVIEREIEDTHLLMPLAAGLEIVNRPYDPRFGFRTEVRADLIDVGGEGRFSVGTTLNLEATIGVSVFLGG